MRASFQGAGWARPLCATFTQPEDGIQIELGLSSIAAGEEELREQELDGAHGRPEGIVFQRGELVCLAIAGDDMGDEPAPEPDGLVVPDLPFDPINEKVGEVIHSGAARDVVEVDEASVISAA